MTLGKSVLKVLAMLVVVSLAVNFSGCIHPEPDVSITYRIDVWSDDATRVYLPVPFDSANRTTAGLVGRLEVVNESHGDYVDLQVIDTARGRALKVEKTGDVDHIALRASGSNEYFEKYPRDFAESHSVWGQRYFNFSMPVNNSGPAAYERYVYLDPDTASEGVKIRITLTTDTESHLNTFYLPKEGRISLDPGWQRVDFELFEAVK